MLYIGNQIKVKNSNEIVEEKSRIVLNLENRINKDENKIKIEPRNTDSNNSNIEVKQEIIEIQLKNKTNELKQNKNITNKYSYNNQKYNNALEKFNQIKIEKINNSSNKNDSNSQRINDQETKDRSVSKINSDINANINSIVNRYNHNKKQ